jgi:molybdopterin converting factor small subunit
MNITVRVFGPEIFPKQEISMECVSSTLKDVARILLDQRDFDWKHIIKDDLSLAENYALLVNGRNIMSLEEFETIIHEGDELVFTVPVMGG